MNETECTGMYVEDRPWGLNGSEPTITVGIMDRQREVSGRLNGEFRVDGSVTLSGRFLAKVQGEKILLTDETGHEITGSTMIRLAASADSVFQLFDVTIGKEFHWERKEDQTFRGDLLLCLREEGTIAVINETPLEDYLNSVISSEMSGSAPPEFLKAHAVVSRSWLLAALRRKGSATEPAGLAGDRVDIGAELVRWYDREEHDLYDVCADDHCQRYQGITKIISGQAGTAVRETRGLAITYEDQICDARYSKACGGMTEDFATAWADKEVPYLASVSDAPVPHDPIGTEEEAARFILSEPGAYCNTKDEDLLATILPGFDRETKRFFRWRVEYSREELEGILKNRSGLDFGTLKEIVPLQRGPSGRIVRLTIAGSKKTIVVGKELEIRRWLSRTHLLSSAFIVEVDRDPYGIPDRFVFHGAGWGHGVGLCQIGAAVMATRGFEAGQILKHYFKGAEIRKAY
jgi:stage II sporulation protein D